MKKAILAVAIIAATNLRAQNPTSGFVYFKTDKHHLDEADKIHLDSVLLTLESTQLDSIVVYGNTDNVGDDAYNLRLSEKRANSVNEYLAARYKGVSIRPSFFGEQRPLIDNLTDDNRRKNRRVEVYFYQKQQEKPSQKIMVNKTNKSPRKEKSYIAPPAKCLSESPALADDTLVNIGDDVLVEMKKVDAKKRCVEIELAINSDQIEAAGYLTVTENGDPLESGGMLELKECAPECMNVPLKIFIPYKNRPGMSLFTSSSSGKNWKLSDSNQKLRVVTKNKKQYYEVTINRRALSPRGGGFINLDKKVCECQYLNRKIDLATSKRDTAFLNNLTHFKRLKMCPTCYKKIRIKTPSHLKLTSAFIASQSPNLFRTEVHLSKNGKIGYVSCNAVLDNIQCSAKDKQGQEFKLIANHICEVEFKNRFWGHHFNTSILKRKYKYKKANTIVLKCRNFVQVGDGSLVTN